MPDHTILIINFDTANMVTGCTVHDIVHAFYVNNSIIIKDMKWYKIGDETLLKEIQTLCEEEEKQNDAAIMAELNYEQEQAEAQAMYEAEMQAQEEAEAEREAEMQAEYEGGYW